MKIQYNAYQSIKLGKNTTEKDLYELFGDAVVKCDKAGKEIKDYFNKYGDSKYNLWIGGTAKSNVSNPKFWKKIWGSNWKTFIQT